jgi:hypothetical protein
VRGSDWWGWYFISLDGEVGVGSAFLWLYWGYFSVLSEGDGCLFILAMGVVVPGAGCI